MTPSRIVLGIVLIIQGLFLWFALAFNVVVGETFVNYSLFTSALLMIVLGGSKFTKSKKSTSLILGLVSIAFYLPMVWQRLNTNDTGTLLFDAWVIGVLLFTLISKPNH